MMKENENKQPHIRLGSSIKAKYAILPGDPKRVDRIGTFLSNVQNLAFNREYKSLTGEYNGVPILALSTGIGGASMAIAVEELHNIGIQAAIRVGSCGALSKDIHLGDMVLVNGAVRDDGASKAYVESQFPAVPNTGLLLKTIEAAHKLKAPYQVGIARSHDSFYIDEEEDICNYWSKRGVIGSDMETAALFTVGTLRGMKTASVLNTVVGFEGDLEGEINQYVEGENAVMDGEKIEILIALKALSSLD